MNAEVKSGKSRDRNSIRVSVGFDREKLRLVDTVFGVVIEMEDAPLQGEPGGPGLPGSVIRVALPPFSQVTRVAVEDVSSVLLTKEPVLVAPIQRPQPGAAKKPPRPKDPGGPDGPEDPDGSQKPEPEESNRSPQLKPSLQRGQPEERFMEPIPAPPFEPPQPELYEREAKEPRPLARLLAVEENGMAPVAVIGLSPVRITEKGLLEFFPEMAVTIYFEPAANPPNPNEGAENQITPFRKPIQSRAQAQRLVDLVRMQVINPESVFDFSHLFPVLLIPVDYLIITDNQAWNAAAITPAGAVGDMTGAFQRLADWKARRGLKTRVVTVSDIVAGVYGNFTAGARDLQEVLRNFIKWAYDAWGVAWLLLGGDVSVIPVRRVPGASEGHIGVQTAADPPGNNQSFWTGSFLKMKVVNPGTWWPGSRTDHLLVRADNGMLIPYDSSGATASGGLGWYFTTSDSYTTRSTMPTQFVRVNGSSAQVNTLLQWLYEWNTLPTDLYYADLVGPNYNLPGVHDWDLLNNNIYGQHTDSLDLDGVNYQTDISVGRAPVSSQSQAAAFVDKVIAYEQFRRPDGSLLDNSYPRRMLLVSSNWGGRMWISATSSNPPEGNRYFHASGANRTLIRLQDVPTDLKWQLIAQVSASDVRLIPYNRSASGSSRGWYYATTGTGTAVSEMSFHIFGMTFNIPIPTNWVLVFATAAELAPQGFIYDRVEQDGSLHDQEQLRTQVAAELPAINTVSRLYEDEVDLTLAEAAAGPVEHLTEDRLRNALNAGPHFVSLSGHGSSDGCCWLSGAMAQNLTNGFHSFIGYADSCLTNQFDAEDAVSERLLYNLNGGAVAYIGNTRFSWIGVGDNFQRAFFHRLTSTRHLGLLNDVRTGMVNEWTGFYKLYNKWAVFTLNLMGDPEMPVWVGRPQTMDVSFPRVVDKRKPFKVKVEFDLLFLTLPLSGATVHIRQGSFTRLAVTNAAGEAGFDLNPAGLGELEVTVTRTGFIPFIDKARITGPAWVSGDVLYIDHQHSSPLQTLIRLHLDPAIDGDANRGWFATKLNADYSVILDAATDAYISGKRISLFVDNTDEGGKIERFRFGSVFLRPLFEIGIDRISVAADGQPAETLTLAGTDAITTQNGANGSTNGGPPAPVEETAGEEQTPA